MRLGALAGKFAPSKSPLPSPVADFWAVNANWLPLVAAGILRTDQAQCRAFLGHQQTTLIGSVIFCDYPFDSVTRTNGEWPAESLLKRYSGERQALPPSAQPINLTAINAELVGTAS